MDPENQVSVNGFPFSARRIAPSSFTVPGFPLWTTDAASFTPEPFPQKRWPATASSMSRSSVTSPSGRTRRSVKRIEPCFTRTPFTWSGVPFPFSSSRSAMLNTPPASRLTVTEGFSSTMRLSTSRRSSSGSRESLKVSRSAVRNGDEPSFSMMTILLKVKEGVKRKEKSPDS